MAPVQVSPQTSRDGLSTSRPSAPSPLGLLGFSVELLQVGALSSGRRKTSEMSVRFNIGNDRRPLDVDGWFFTIMDEKLDLTRPLHVF